MARIAGINIPPHKHAEIGLTSIFGIGRTRARKICEACGIDYAKKIKDLTDSDLEKIRDQIAEFTIEDDLHDSFPVPQIDENYTAMVASAMGPSHENHFFIHIGNS